MYKKLTFLVIITIAITMTQSAQAYLMSRLKYSNLFEYADVVVIATAVSSVESKTKLKVNQPKEILDLITTIDTEFKMAYVLKGELDSKVFHFLHLNRKDHKPFSGMFGAVGTFFIDFGAEENKRKSYILFMMKQKDGTFCPAWNPMEGSRAIIAVPKDGEL